MFGKVEIKSQWFCLIVKETMLIEQHWTYNFVQKMRKIIQKSFMTGLE
jgi:hypothetical protein